MVTSTVRNEIEILYGFGAIFCNTKKSGTEEEGEIR